MTDDDIERRLRSDARMWRDAGGHGQAGEHEQLLRAATAPNRSVRHRTVWLSSRALAAVSAAVVVAATAVILVSSTGSHPSPEAPPVGSTFPVPTLTASGCPSGRSPQGLSVAHTHRGGNTVMKYPHARLAAAALTLVATAVSGCAPSAASATRGSTTPSNSASSASSSSSSTSSRSATASSPAPSTNKRTVSMRPSIRPARPTHSASKARPSSAHPVGTSATPNCTGGQLATTSVGDPNGGDGNDALEIVFTNIGSSPCMLFGYPGAALLDKNGKQYVQAERTLGGYVADCGCTSPPHLKLAPGGKASTAVEGNVAGGNECLQGRNTLITPPNTTRAIKLSGSTYSCNVQIHPVIAGTGGGGHN